MVSTYLNEAQTPFCGEYYLVYFCMYFIIHVSLIMFLFGSTQEPGQNIIFIYIPRL